ncbi:MAG: NAD(P)H-dependent oxidoreductase [Devosiaceae bacterium]|nr:NAD(P)H-dependent oxidoreductase [Devosiaceae bacterium MH13]
MSTVSFLAFSGSTRQGSLNTRLAAAVTARAAKLGADAQHISLADYPAPLFDPTWEAENGVPEPIVELHKLVSAQDAVFIASPEYNGGYTPLLKNTIDWLSRVKAEGRHPFRSPVYSLGAVSPGVQGGVNGLFQLRPTIARLGAIVMPEQITLGGGGSAFDDKGDFTNERTESLAQAQLTRLLAVAGKLKD